jgi:predicted ATPase/class 3 adenylate cyclase
MAALPSGTVTFLFTDIEGSSRLWDADRVGMERSLARHHEILREAIDGHNGYVFATGGDGFAAAFSRAGDAVGAALAAQLRLAVETWPESAVLRVRMGLHTGEVDERGGDYLGPEVNRAARLMAIAHGGQILVSEASEPLVHERLPEGSRLVDLGEQRLRDLSEPLRVFQLEAPGIEAHFPPPRAVNAFPGNLPLQVSSFIGRQREIARIAGAIGDARVVTLTGVGGVGKTRLALQVAGEVLPRFREGAWLVELAPVRDPDGVVDAFAAVFAISPRGGLSLTDALVDFLRTKHLLLIVDNCEHLLEPVADLLEVVERSCAGVVVMATSREGLALEGERVIPVPSLEAPRSDADVDDVLRADAVRLFIERALSADPDFALTGQNAPAVTQVCRRLDGIPLAIELAAARVRAMNLSELVGGLNRRFEILAGGRRRAVQRHQTLRAAIDWSYELLSEAEQCLLGRLAVFAGGCTRHAAEGVCAGGPVARQQLFQLLSSLVEKSLVVAERDKPETRYRLLETIREYGEERLAQAGATEPLRGLHAHFYRDFARDLSEQLTHTHDIGTAKRLFAEQENLLAAVNYAIDIDDADLALQLLYYSPSPARAGQVGNATWLPIDAILALPGAADHPLYAFALGLAAYQAGLQGDVVVAQRRCDEATAAIGHPGARLESDIEVMIESARAVALTSIGELQDAASHHERVAEIYRGAGRPWEAASCLAAAASIWSATGQAGAAVRCATEGLALARQSGMAHAIVLNLAATAFALADSDLERARALLRESNQLRATLDYESWSELNLLVSLSGRVREWSLALELASMAIPHLQWQGNRFSLASELLVVARALAPSRPESAGVLLGAADGLNQIQSKWTDELRQETISIAVASLGEDRLRELQTQGKGMDHDHAAAYAVDEMAKARIAILQ